MRILRSLVPLMLAACAVDGAPGDDVELATAESELDIVIYRPPSPRWNHVFGKATHNSFHFNRNHLLDLYASGASEQLIDQLLFEKVGAVEFDLRGNYWQAGDFVVAHTDRPDFSGCNPFSDCLEMLRSFHYAVPDHDPILVIIDLKGNPLVIGTNTFDGTHTIEDLDWNIRRVLGSSLYQPGDFLAECSDTTSMMACLVERGGWPTLKDLRGKFVVAVKGDWDNNYNDWIAYGSRDDVRLRAAFPMRNVYDEHGIGFGTFTAGTGDNHGPVDPVAEQRARDNSVIWQVEGDNPAYNAGKYIVGATYGTAALKDLVLVRGGQSDGSADLAPALDGQRSYLNMGFTWFSTDFAWNTFIEHGPGTNVNTVWPYNFKQRYYDPNAHLALIPQLAPRPSMPPAALLERGNRIAIRSVGPYWPFAYNDVPANSYRWWETTVSLTRHANTYGINRARTAQEGGRGCLRAAASQRDWVEICRSKDGGAGDVTIQDRTVITVRTTSNGTIANERYEADVEHRDSLGAHLAMEVENRGPGSIVRLFTAGRIAADGTPEWRLMKELTLPFALAKQGLASEKDALFVGTRYRDESGAWRSVTRCDLAKVDDSYNPLPVVPEIMNASVPGAGDDACVAQVVRLPATSAPIGTAWRQILKDVGSELAVANRPDGTRYVFYRAYDGSIRYSSAGDGLAGGNLGGWLAPRAPVVGRYNDGRFHVFAIGGDGAVWHTQELSVGGVWSGWASLGGWVTDIAVGINQDGRLELYVVGGGGVLYQKWQGSVGGNWYGGWYQMSGAMGGAPAVASHRDGRQIVFARGTDGAIWMKPQAQVNGGWGAWMSLGGGLVGKPTAMRDAWGYLLVFAAGTDGNVWSRTQTAPSVDSFSGWTQRSSGVAAGNPVVVPMADGGWDVFSRNADSRIMHMTQGRGWWATLAGYQPGWASEPAVGRKRDGRMTAVAADFHGTLWESDVP